MRESTSVNRYLVKATTVGALGGLLFGFDTTVIAGTTQQLSEIFHLTPARSWPVLMIARFVDGSALEVPLSSARSTLPNSLPQSGEAAWSVSSRSTLSWGFCSLIYPTTSSRHATSAGFSSNSAALQTVGVGLVNLLATFLGMSLIDKLGRKTLLLIGAVGMAIALSGVALIFHSHAHQGLLVWMLVLFIIFFAISQGSVIWVYIAEIFPSRVRSKGQNVGSSSHWIMNALIAGVFPYVAAKSQAAPFAFFAAMMVLQFILVLIFFPETKGRTLEQIQAKLGLG
jgi:MFS family permease